MIVAIDGAVKKPGTADCLSVGCAFFPDGPADALYEVKVETRETTSQRGEINGLICALQRAIDAPFDEDDSTVVIVTDSQYLHDTIVYEWVQKWESAGWISASGEPPKNLDLWQHVNEQLKQLDSKGLTLAMQWTKGHLFRYPAGKITACMKEDYTGATLLSAITSLMSVATSRATVVKAFNKERTEHGFAVLPDTLAAEFVAYNTVADAIAVYVANLVQAAKDSNMA